ncbi:hypothetical protein NN561_016348 [Cricetulus griseus]
MPHLGAGADPRGRHLPRPILRTVDRDSISRSPRPPAEPHAATASPQPLALTCGHRCTRGARSRAGRGRENRLLLPPAQALPSPGRLRSRRRCPLLQYESRRRRAGPGPGRPGNRDSTWRRALRCRAHPLSAPSRGAAPPAQPRRRAKEAGGYVAAVTRYAGPPPGTRVAAERREVRQPSGSEGEGLWLGLTSGPFPGSSSLFPSPKVLVTPTFSALSLLSAAPFWPFNPSLT